MNDSPDYNTIGRRMALVKGSENAFKFIAKGIENLCNDYTYQNFAQLPLLILSFGTEQLLKLIICSHQKMQTGKYPELIEIRGHRVHKLSKRVASNCFSSSYLEREDIRIGHEFIIENKTLQKLLESFEWYSGGNPAKTQGRYFDLDEITTDKHLEDPENHGLGGIELELIQSYNLGIGREAISAAGKLIIECLIKYYRVLAHLIRFGDIGDIKLTSKYTSAIIGERPINWYRALSREVTIHGE